MAPARTLPSLVMVPGAWHTPALFESSTRALEALGHRVIVVSYPSVASPMTPTGLTEDTAAVRAAVLAELDLGHDVVTISHSYGGAPTVNALAGLASGPRRDAGEKTAVLRMGMATAWLVGTGESLAGTAAALTRGGDSVGFTVTEDGATTIPEDPVNVFFGDAPLKKAAVFASECRPQALSTFTEELTYAAWKEIPISYLFCEGDRAIRVHVQRAMVARVKAEGADIETSVSQSCHEIMNCNEDEFVEWVQRVVGKAMAENL